jgi:phosphoribosylglycinamide formyltransferase 2
MEEYLLKLCLYSFWQMRIFGKPEVVGHRRLAVLLASADTLEEARAKVNRAYDKLQIEVLPR